MTETLLSVRFGELADLAVTWALVWAAISWLRTTRARLALAGLAILAAIYVLARQLGLVLTTWILQSFAAVAVLVAVVVFQQDLRRLFERIAALGLRRSASTGPDSIDTLARTIVELAQQRRGALIVIPGREPVEGHVEGGLPLDARVTEPLLLSLFDPHSPGHDGALMLSGDRAARFGVHLPISTDRAQLGQRGTRHAAALGLAEQTDALCIAVSEERGTVSVAVDGRFRTLDAPQEITAEIRSFLGRTGPATEERPGGVRRVLQRWREGLFALPVAGLLWLLAIPGGTFVEVDREVRVSVGGIPPAYQLEGVEPERVRVTLAGRRRVLYLLRPDAVSVRVDAILVELGRRSFPLTRANVEHPDNVEVRAIHPDGVRVELVQRGAPSAERSQ
jgi:uncharacterized protein (TIGR00159 family)